MSAIHDELRAQPDFAAIVGSTPWSATVAVGASDMGERVMVTIPGLDPALRVGPCRWQARDATSHPARGNSCLVVFDDQGEPWLIAWWPFTT